MQVVVSKSAGYCFGVKRAVDMVYKLLDTGEKVCTLGYIIHNTHLIDELKSKGVRIIAHPSEAGIDEIVVLRSHGVTKDVMDYIKNNNLKYADASCPHVTRTQRIVEEQSKEERAIIVIAGDPEHPEVQATASYSKNKCYIVQNHEQLDKVINISNVNTDTKLIMLSQTTFNSQTYESFVKKIKKQCTNYVFFDTICSATFVRQQEAIKLAQACDIMIVVGDRQSSNTAKLKDVCQQYCKTYLIESALELYYIDFSNCIKVGLTAGASTPAGIIKEVKLTMNEFLNDIDANDISFEEGLEQTLKSVHNGDRVMGYVTAVSPTEVQVEIGTKHAGYIPLNELTEDPTKETKDIVSVGDEIELMIIRVNDVEGTVMLSKKRLDAIAGYDKICKASESGEILEGVVTEVVRGGVIATSNGTRVFIPASQTSVSKNESLDQLLKTKVSFKVIEVNRSRKRAVGSIRVVAKEQRKVLEDKFWETVSIGKKYTGEVKSLTSYGAFVDLGGVDGMVHISELSWNRIKDPSEVLKQGDMVEVYIKDIDEEKRKISLGYKKTEDNPWEILRRNFQIDDVVKAKVVSITSFGVFANISPGVDGLIHISQISTERVEKPEDVLSIGQEVDVKIINIDYEDKRVSLSIKALLEDEKAQSEDYKTPVEEAEEKTVVYEAGPEGAVGEAPSEE